MTAFSGTAARDSIGLSTLCSGMQEGSASYLAQRFELGLHDELILAQLTAASVGALDPLL